MFGLRLPGTENVRVEPVLSGEYLSEGLASIPAQVDAWIQKPHKSDMGLVMPRFRLARTPSPARRSRDIIGRPFWHVLLLSAIAAATQAVQRIRGRAGPLRVKWPVEAQPLRAALAGERQGGGGQGERHAGGAVSQNLLRELDVLAVVLLVSVQLGLHLVHLFHINLQLGLQMPDGAKVGVPLVDVVDYELRR